MSYKSGGDCTSQLHLCQQQPTHQPYKAAIKLGAMLFSPKRTRDNLALTQHNKVRTSNFVPTFQISTSQGIMAQMYGRWFFFSPLFHFQLQKWTRHMGKESKTEPPIMESHLKVSSLISVVLPRPNFSHSEAQVFAHHS